MTVTSPSSALQHGAPLRIDAARLQDRLAMLSSIGGIQGTTGAARLAFSDADRQGRDLVVTWMEDLGLEVRIDAIGNVVGTLAGTEDLPAVMTGSHIDTVRTGGRYDGNLGVLAGLEVIETVLAAGVQTRHPISVGFFSNEEGARFQPRHDGVARLRRRPATRGGVRHRRDRRGTVRDELDRIGYLGRRSVPGLVPHAYLELHIEQGPVLEEAGIQIGVVEGCKASRGPNSRSSGSRIMPAPPRCACATIRRGWRPRSPRSFGGSRWNWAPAGGHGGPTRAAAQSRQCGGGPSHDDRRLATPTTRCSKRPSSDWLPRWPNWPSGRGRHHQQVPCSL
ncbi:MAG: M20/M25/M40 family metallo-hydrolase [Acidimicrobiales bacterium]